MDKSHFEKMASRLREVNTVIADLDEAIKADAFTLLRPYVEGRGVTPKNASKPKGRGESTTDEEEAGSIETVFDVEAVREFLAENHSEKPADNAKAVAAYIFSVYGASAFTVHEVNDLAHEAGVIVPNRIDVTLNGATADKKQLFTKVKTNVFRPTVHGEKFLKDTYGVTKGTRRRTDGV